MRLIVSAPDDFDFRTAVCSHGFFVLAPNRWDPARATLHTTITLDENTAVTVRISEAPRRKIAIQTTAALSPAHRAATKTAVTRMLRVDEDLTAFHDLCRNSATHRLAADMRFGRLIRGTDLFEDIVKVICTCNVTWRQTVSMVDRIVSHWGVPANPSDPALRGFPSPARLASAGVTHLRDKARLGYRAVFVHRLAADIAEGRLDLAPFSAYAGPTDDLVRELRSMHGVGDYAASHITMLLGRYDRLAIDSETLRFLKARHPRRRWTPAAIRRYYESWYPYQFLAYWFELWRDYELKHGQADQWNPAVIGTRITSTPTPNTPV